MIIKPTIKLEITLTINSDEAEILLHLTDYDLAKWFVDRCNRTVPAERIKAVLTDLRSKLHRVEELKKKATEVMVGANRKEGVE